MSWEFLVGQYRLADRCVRSLICIQVVQLEPPASAFTIFGVFGCVCFASVLFLAWMRLQSWLGGLRSSAPALLVGLAEDGE